MKTNRTASLLIIALTYIVACAIGVAVYLLLPDEHLFPRILFGDIAATVFVYLVSLIVRNSSVYDPYWSVAPIAICTLLAWESGRFDLPTILLLTAIWFWGVRLTANWAHTFENLASQDWRYDDLRARFPRIFPLINLFGIMMFPTLVVYLCLLPAVAYLRGGTVNALTFVGFAVCVGAATLQMVADIHMHRFRRRNAGAHLLIREGLWRHSRHPNYLGEILMWWCVFLMMISTLPEQWYLGVGALVNTLMFTFVSIPMADKRNRRLRSGYEEYVQHTNALLPMRLPWKGIMR